MNYAESIRKCAEWKRKYKEEKIGKQNAEMRLNVETDRADLAGRDKLRAEAELAFAKQVFEGEREAMLKKEASLTDKVERLAKKVAELEKIKKIHDNAHAPSSETTDAQKKIAAGKAAGRSATSPRSLPPPRRPPRATR